MNFIGKFINMNIMNNKIYDITLCTVACTKKEKYANRLKDYINTYGYKLRNNNIKIKFVFLVEDEPRPSFINKNDVWYNCTDIPFSMRWIKYLKENEVDSKWIMQVDDDSSTDIDKTLEILDQYYDCEDSVMLMGGRNTDLENTQQRILRLMKVNNFFYESEDITKFDGIPYFTHAWEPTILSKSGHKKIKNWNRLEEYYKLCKTHKPTFTDQAPYVLARLAKIPIAEAPFLCPFEWANMYSAINKQGRYSHIHYVTEKWSHYNNFKKAMKENISFNNEEETKIFLNNGITSYKYENQEDLSNTTWKFLGNGKLYGMIRLNSDGTVGIYSNDNEKYWEFKNGSIQLLNKDRQPTSILNKINDTKFEGKYLFSNDMIHKLVRN